MRGKTVVTQGSGASSRQVGCVCLSVSLSVFLEVTQAEGTWHTLFPEAAPFPHWVVGIAGRARLGTYFPNAVLAEVFVVAENDNFAGHGCTDAEPVLNLKSNQGNRKKAKEGHWCVYWRHSKTRN